MAGRLSLGEAFWIWSNLLPGLAVLAVVIGEAIAGQSFNYRVVETAVWVIFAPAFIGVWRSADVYQGRAVWKWLARLWVVAWGSGVSLAIFSFDWVPDGLSDVPGASLAIAISGMAIGLIGANVVIARHYVRMEKPWWHTFFPPKFEFPFKNFNGQEWLSLWGLLGLSIFLVGIAVSLG